MRVVSYIWYTMLSASISTRGELGSNVNKDVSYEPVPSSARE